MTISKAINDFAAEDRVQRELERNLPPAAREALRLKPVTLTQEQIGNLREHPFRTKFGLEHIQPADELNKDVAQHGLQIPIIVFSEFVVDGRRRLEACKISGQTPFFRILPPEAGPYLEDIFVSQNFVRRNIGKSQYAMIGAQICIALQEESSGLGKSAERARKMIRNAVVPPKSKRQKKSSGRSSLQRSGQAIKLLSMRTGTIIQS